MIDWPKPREDPEEEPTEPWARPGARPWRELLEEVERRDADEEADPKPELLEP